MDIPGLTGAQVIGRGAFAVVYRARQTALDRDVAVKVRPARPADNPSADVEGIARFTREGAALGRLAGHPHVVAVHANGVLVDGRPYLVLDYLHRGTLHENVVRRGPLTWHQVARTGVKLAGALESAHRRGILHRDVKPQNILVSDCGEPLLADFGSALVAGRPDTPLRGGIGSVPYCAPEVLDGAPATPRSDVYSLAATLYFLVAGEPPFSVDAGEPLVSLYLRVAHHQPPTAPASPDGLVRLLQSALAKDPVRRPATALAFGVALQDVLSSTRRSGAELVVVPRAAAAHETAPGTTLGAGAGRSARGSVQDADADTVELVDLPQSSDLPTRFRDARVPGKPPTAPADPERPALDAF